MKVIVLMSCPSFLGIEPSEIAHAWKAIEYIPDIEPIYVKLNSPSSFDEKIKFIGDADAVIGLGIGDDQINEKFLNTHPNLKYIASLDHGFGYFDSEMTKSKGVTITNTIYGDVTIAQYTMALLFEICHNIGRHSSYIKKDYLKGTPDKKNFKKVFSRQIELYNKTIGIFGLGNIGFHVAQMADGLGMKVLGCSRSKKTDPKYDFIEQVSFDELLQRSDIISLNAPLTKSTANIINKDTIDKMKDGVILLNTARGGLIVEEDLVNALNSGKIYAAGLDVLKTEPPVSKTPLMECPNAIITGHIAWHPAESRFRAIKIAIENFKNYLDGNPTSVINK